MIMIMITLITSNYCPNILNFVKFFAKLKILVTSLESSEKYVIRIFLGYTLFYKYLESYHYPLLMQLKEI